MNFNILNTDYVHTLNDITWWNVACHLGYWCIVVKGTIFVNLRPINILTNVVNYIGFNGKATLTLTINLTTANSMDMVSVLCIVLHGDVSVFVPIISYTAVKEVFNLYCPSGIAFVANFADFVFPAVHVKHIHGRIVLADSVLAADVVPVRRKNRKSIRFLTIVVPNLKVDLVLTSQMNNNKLSLVGTNIKNSV